jgi:hypothetical protein
MAVSSSQDAGALPLSIVLRCDQQLEAKVRYVFDTLFMARGIPVVYRPRAPEQGVWLLYGPREDDGQALDRCLAVAHLRASWGFLLAEREPVALATREGLPALFSDTVVACGAAAEVSFDVAANAFYFLSSWSERGASRPASGRQLHSASVYARLNVPQDIVDRYLDRLVELLGSLCKLVSQPAWAPLRWPEDAGYALVLSHDIDFLPARPGDTTKQALKSVLRHLVRHKDPADAARAAFGFLRAQLAGTDPYGCVPEIIGREQGLGIKASFQVAVGHGHPHDVNYRIEDDRVRDYLRAIVDAGFDLCLHGSYLSTDSQARYIDEVALLSRRLATPLGSRQHFLSFQYDTLFAAQERAAIQYDMSIGYPDRPGPRCGFSYPFFPYCLQEDRPYDVVELSLFLMDVTLRSYLNLKAMKAWDTTLRVLEDLRHKRGCASVVWHPIVFGGARDPGYEDLFWRMAAHVRQTGGLATDGRTVNRFWRALARGYSSFACAG